MLKLHFTKACRTWQSYIRAHNHTVQELICFVDDVIFVYSYLKDQLSYHCWWIHTIYTMKSKSYETPKNRTHRPLLAQIFKKFSLTALQNCFCMLFVELCYYTHSYIQASVGGYRKITIASVENNLSSLKTVETKFLYESC